MSLERVAVRDAGADRAHASPFLARFLLRFDVERVPAAARAALVGYVLLGKLSPPHAQSIADESRAPDGNAAASFGRFLERIDPGLLAAARDPMSGIVTPVLHRGLFGDGVDLVGALDRLAGHGGPSGLALIGEYVAFQIRCRRHVVATALGLAKHLEALDLASVPAGQELFEWWRRTFTERVPIRLTGGRSAAVSIPRGVAAAWRIGAARMLQGLGETFTALSRTIGAASDPAAFVETVSVELNDGLVGLLLNRLSGRACPHAREITTTLADSRYPSRARLVKELDVQGVPWRDGLGRFFAAPRTTARLPGRGVEVVVWQAGTCPFADFGYAQATSDPSSPAYCPGLD